MTTMQTEFMTADQVSEILGLLQGADSVELKFTVPDGNRRSAVAALGMDPLDAQIRQVVFFDTPDLALDRMGVVVRARRVQGKGDDSVVKLRPVVPDQLPDRIRRTPGFGVEVDAMTTGFVCSGSMKAKLEKPRVKDVLGGHRPIRKVFTKDQRAFFAEHAPGHDLDALTMLGPINVLKLKFSPEGYDRRLVAELWLYPDGSRILELSTKCEPALAFDVAAESKTFLRARGIDLQGEQQTKTRTTLELFAREAREDAATPEPETGAADER
jgi:hypothetical protein